MRDDITVTGNTEIPAFGDVMTETSIRRRIDLVASDVPATLHSVCSLNYVSDFRSHFNDAKTNLPTKRRMYNAQLLVCRTTFVCHV